MKLRRLLFALVLTLIAVPSFAEAVCGICYPENDECVWYVFEGTKCVPNEHPCTETSWPAQCGGGGASARQTSVAAPQWEVVSIEVETAVQVKTAEVVQR